MFDYILRMMNFCDQGMKKEYAYFVAILFLKKCNHLLKEYKKRKVFNVLLDRLFL